MLRVGLYQILNIKPLKLQIARFILGVFYSTVSGPMRGEVLGQIYGKLTGLVICQII